MPKFLITGSQSGLGKHLHKYFGGIGFQRQTNQVEWAKAKKNGVDIIVHCAAQPPKLITSKSLPSYLDDNLLLTKKLVEIPHKKFVFISSVEVYPKSSKTHTEDEEIPLESIPSFYGICKLLSESIVQEACRDFLILRCVSLLGPYARPNSLTRILGQKGPSLSLSGDSTLNYVRHHQISEFINYAAENSVTGIYNVASSKNVTLDRIAKLHNKKVRFGSYKYDVGNISNRKIVSIFPEFNRTSIDVINQFISEDLPKRKARKGRAKARHS